jgi:RHS repeat-associated protein
MQNSARPKESRYKFTEKERDNETSYDYFGARYYNNKLGVWLSADPLADKYPGWSPYTYVRNSPLNLIDPLGMDDTVYIDGPQSNDAVDEINKTNKSLKVSRDEKSGKLSYEGTAESDAEIALKAAIDDETVETHLITTDKNSYLGKNGEVNEFVWGQTGYVGNEGNISVSKQYINLDHVIGCEAIVGTKGQVAMHEVLEGYAASKYRELSSHDL